MWKGDASGTTATAADDKFWFSPVVEGLNLLKEQGLNLRQN
jgi:hypothetical protein